MKWANLDDIRNGLKAQFEFPPSAGDGAPLAPLFRPYAWREPRLIPRRQWMYGGHFIRQFLTGTFAPGAGGKSMLEIVEALAMATGKPLLGIQPLGRFRVGYWNGEDPLEETERRVAAAMMHFGLVEADVKDWFFWGTGRESELIIAEQTKDGTVINRPNVERVETEFQDLGLDLAIIDPFVSSHRVTENDNNAIDAVAKQWARIAGTLNMGVEVVHHTTKAAIGREVKVEDGRGGGALLFATRSARVLNTMSAEEAEAAGVPLGKRRFHFRVDNGKANLAPPPEKSDWYRFIGVDLGNGENFEPGDNIGVVTPWQWPEGAEQPRVEAPRSTSGKKSGGLSPSGQKVMQAFGRLFDDGATQPAPPVPGVKPGTRAVALLDLRNKAIELGIFPEPKPDASDAEAVKTWKAGARQAWNRGWKAVEEGRLLRLEGSSVWEIYKKSSERVTSRDEEE